MPFILFPFERKEREKPDLSSGPAYGRRVSVRAVAGALFFFISCPLSLPLRSSVIDRLVGALVPQPSSSVAQLLE